MPHGMWDLPRPGIKPAPPEAQVWSFTLALKPAPQDPPGHPAAKTWHFYFKEHRFDLACHTVPQVRARLPVQEPQETRVPSLGPWVRNRAKHPPPTSRAPSRSPHPSAVRSTQHPTLLPEPRPGSARTLHSSRAEERGGPRVRPCGVRSQSVSPTSPSFGRPLKIGRN